MDPQRTCLTASVVMLFVCPCAAQTGLLDGHITLANSASINPPGDFTLEAWIRPTAFHFDGNTDTSYQPILTKWGSGGNNRSYLLALYQDQVEFAVSPDGTSENSVGIYSAVHLALNDWVHVAGVCSGGTMHLFVDGHIDPQTIVSAPFAAQAGITIGGRSPPFQSFHGTIDEVRISYIARYTANFNRPAVSCSPDSHTVVLLNLNEGAGTFTDNVGTLGGDGTLDASDQWGMGAPAGSAAPGDLNCDGVLDFFDIDPFLVALLAESQYATRYPGCCRTLADMNDDGFVDFFDIDPFLTCLFAGCA